MNRKGIVAVSLLVACLFGVGPAAAVDFVRGDANGDGAVTVSDTYFLNAYLFLGSRAPECMNAADFNGDGTLDISDAVAVLKMLLLDGQSPPAPFPAPGPDPNDLLPCESYGNGFNVTDPSARIEVLSAHAAGGTDRRVSIILAISSSKFIAGFDATLGGAGDLVEEVFLNSGQHTGVRDLTGAFGGGLWGKVADGKIRVGGMVSFTELAQIAPGDAVPACEVLVCLKPGTPAGQYPLTLLQGELISTCVVALGCDDRTEGGHAIIPALGGGTLVVDEQVSSEADCNISVPTPPAPINILFKLTDASAAPGGSVTVPLIVKADRPSTGFSYSIDFDEGLLESTGTKKLWQKPDGTPYEFEKFEFNNRNDLPGNAGVDEGFLTGAVIISLTDTGAVLPPWKETEVLEFDFAVHPDVPAGSTELAFRDGARGSGGPVNNKLIAGGVDINPSLASSFVFINARINIVPDVTSFIRGDSNGDGSVDISDPTVTLGHLYLGGSAPACADAADANDDGDLDIADPVLTLQVLFLSGGALPQPWGARGADPTPDALGCSSARS